MGDRKSLLSGLDVPSGKAGKTRDAHARADLLELGGGAGAAKASKTKAAAPEAGPSGERSRSGDRLKLGIVTLCLGVAGVLLAQYTGLIELWGSTPPPAPPTQEEVQHVQEGVKQIQQEQQRIESLPPEKRPIQAGS